VLLWDAAKPGSRPVELGRGDREVGAVAALPDGRVVSAGRDGRVLLWDAAKPSSDPVELARHDSSVEALAVLPTDVVNAADRG